MISKKSKKVVNKILIQIIRSMIRGQLKRGERLPSEEKLAADLKVSRSSVREALKVLEALGLVEIYHGKGTYVPTKYRQPVINPLQFLLFLGDGTPEELVAFRFALELGFYRIAQLTVTEQDILQLEQAIQKLEEAYQRGHISVEHDLAFHYLILETTRNPFIVQQGKWMLSLFRDSIDTGVRRYTKEAIRHHKQILQALKSGDLSELDNALRDSYVFWKNTLKSKL